MNYKAIWISLLLILAPAFSIFYKMHFLDLSLLPTSSQNHWHFEISVNMNSVFRLKNQVPPELTLPIPPILQSQKVSSLEVLLKGQKQKVDSSKVYLAPVQEPVAGNSYKVRSTVRLSGGYLDTSTVKLRKAQRKEALDTSWIDSESRENLDKLANSLLVDGDSAKEKFNKIIFYAIDEFVVNPRIKNFTQVTKLKSGSQLAQAQFIAALGRISGVPTRISFASKIIETDGPKVKHKRIFFNEFYVNKKWQFFHPDYEEAGPVPPNVLVIFRGVDHQTLPFASRDIYRIVIKAAKTATLDSKEYLDTLVKKGGFWSRYSLYQLPISLQSMFFTLLLIPFGTLILTASRNLIGIKSLGIFTPILLTLFFLETSLPLGLTFLTIVVTCCVLLNSLLNKLYILSVPRLSILLTFVVILYMLFAFHTYGSDLIDKSASVLSYFPIVIVTTFTERLVIQMEEEGLKNTLVTLLGTFFISSGCYLLFKVTFLKLVLFSHPEVLLAAIGLNIFIGTYTGFRLSELIRFKDFYKN